jgi:Tfp pilus assembly protein PilO
VSIPEIFQALGGGLVGLLGVAVVVLAMTIYLDQRAQIKELKADNKELRSTLDRLTNAFEAWSPAEQVKSLRRPR